MEVGLMGPFKIMEDLVDEETIGATETQLGEIGLFFMARGQNLSGK